MSLHHPSPLPSLAAKARKVSLQAQRMRVTPSLRGPGSKFGPSSGHDDRRLSMLGAVAELGREDANPLDMKAQADRQTTLRTVLPYSVLKSSGRAPVRYRLRYPFVLVSGLHRSAAPVLVLNQ